MCTFTSLRHHVTQLPSSPAGTRARGAIPASTSDGDIDVAMPVSATVSAAVAAVAAATSAAVAATASSAATSMPMVVVVTMAAVVEMVLAVVEIPWRYLPAPPPPLRRRDV